MGEIRWLLLLALTLLRWLRPAGVQDMVEAGVAMGARQGGQGGDDKVLCRGSTTRVGCCHMGPRAWFLAWLAGRVEGKRTTG